MEMMGLIGAMEAGFHWKMLAATSSEQGSSSRINTSTHDDSVNIILNEIKLDQALN